MLHTSLLTLQILLLTVSFHLYPRKVTFSTLKMGIEIIFDGKLIILPSRKDLVTENDGWKRLAVSSRKYRLPKLYRILSVIVNPGLSVVILHGNRSKDIETTATTSQVSSDIEVCLQSNTQRSLVNLKLYWRLSKNNTTVIDN
jgi:acid phosphatase class B